MCGLSRVAQKPDCVVYSFGINLESSFEAEILDGTAHCEVWGYDFSVKSFGPEIPPAQSHRTHFHALGLAGEDKDGPGDDPKMYTLETLMKKSGHTHIDILKIDIEGWEFETLTTLLRPYAASGRALPFGQLQLEIHIWDKTFAGFLEWWQMLEAAGLRPFWTEVRPLSHSILLLSCIADVRLCVQPNLVYQNYNAKRTPELAEVCSFLLSSPCSDTDCAWLCSTPSSTSAGTTSSSATASPCPRRTRMARRTTTATRSHRLTPPLWIHLHHPRSGTQQQKRGHVCFLVEGGNGIWLGRGRTEGRKEE